ncbi:MAG: hypothetical protein S4CHLAM45_02910 [Chlamydiales bacterium]|nr:hypothetical protein [Chlamydiales bacterium]MCH9619149.1 hypothetical protein [Chlamydiales bacterium]MCH9622411.1 hypothetical protein [Chlamydiales bacterium]
MVKRIGPSLAQVGEFSATAQKVKPLAYKVGQAVKNFFIKVAAVIAFIAVSPILFVWKQTAKSESLKETFLQSYKEHTAQMLDALGVAPKIKKGAKRERVEKIIQSERDAIRSLLEGKKIKNIHASGRLGALYEIENIGLKGGSPPKKSYADLWKTVCCPKKFGFSKDGDRHFKSS